jgi:pilus assembly protein CpaD
MSGKVETGLRRRAGTGRTAILAVFAVALLAGCAKRDSITVGSVPDDYRTNHPIVVGEQEQVIDMPVGAGTMKLTRGEREVLGGFIAGYERESRAAVRVMVPTGSANAVAASYVSADIVDYLRRQGVHGGSILVDYYDAGAPDASAPIRVSYSALRATAGKCGRWPADILANGGDNKHYANFGCSYQNNLAAQVANPADLLGPRRPSEIDPENRQNAIDQYKSRGIAADMADNREISY